MNIHSGDEDVIIASEIPGIDPADVELTVTGDALSIKGTRKPHEVKEGETWHRRERGSGDFFRTVQLPFNVDRRKGPGRRVCQRRAQDRASPGRG
ncbi:MAG: Hsp20/alpha crystallin family protein [Desulfomicrobium escambiense]|nr:Hsp20/alpha crystallin family protein [Desulfomicrobium escambiense]